MERLAPLTFGLFRLDTEKKRLWRGEEEVALRPTSVAVLQLLVENAPHLVTKEYMLKQVWPGSYVSKVVVRVCIREIRQALDDDAKVSRYVETVGREGYRFIGQTGGGRTSSFIGDYGEGFEDIVGRHDEIAQLEEWVGKARRGQRQIVFVTGEPGIGKTTLIELLLARLRRDIRVKVGRGQCLEQYGEGEPYLPILEALSRLCRDPGGASVAALLSRYAPTWMIQMPSLLSSAELSSLQQRIQGANQQRMLREMSDALEALTTDGLFVLILEDLHWSDYSTLEFLSYLAQRQEHLRLMVIGTYRPADLTTGHLLKKIKREMYVRQQCEELPLALLNLNEVATYVGRRLPEIVGLPELATLVHRRTEGNALFMVNMVHMLHRQMVERGGRWELSVNMEDLRVPESLRQVIEEKIDRLSADDRQILEAASVEGREFSVLAIAAALAKAPLEVEDRCADLMRQSQFVQETDVCEWPDGTITARYEFIHALYQEVLYDRLTPGKRILLHQRIGERLAQGYGNRTEEIATELALHFERGREFFRAVQSLQQAAEHATRRFAYPESIAHLHKGLELIKTFADTVERRQLELQYQTSLGVALMTTKGYASPEAKRAYDRARELCQEIGRTSQIVPILRGLAAFYYVRAELATAHDLGNQLLRIVQDEDDQALLIHANQELGGTLFCLGKFTAALQHLEQGIHLYDSQKHYVHILLYGQDPGVSCLCRASHVLWLLGYPDQALVRSQEALALAEKRGHPYSLAYALNSAVILHQLRREVATVQGRAEEAMQLSTNQEFPIWKIMSEILRGWGTAMRGQYTEGTLMMQNGIASWQAVGAEISLAYFWVLLAEVYGKNGNTKKGLEVLASAHDLAFRTGDQWWEAELYRLKGELLLQGDNQSREVEGLDTNHKVQGLQSKPSKSKATNRTLQLQVEAEACFQESLNIAHQQQAKSLELRTAVSLCQLWQRQGKEVDALELLAPFYGWFQEGFDTVDLKAARGLLQSLRA